MKTIIQIIVALLLFFYGKTSYGQTNEPYDDSLTLYNFGLPVVHQYHIKDSIANSMGFNFKFVAGCTPMPGQMEEIQQHNKEIRKRLKRLLGPNWEEEFNAKCDEAMKEGV
ncbi:hypothetical protein SAMN05216474_3019 [Lishizhenia tianjinensis]|uniref:Uncharacterized protein n=1 Tax=Lishizhenia tianjinensis TaxID=477690 RepID=A0A1I7BRB7_9FLAO|nr:hypothetical protein [Lishizhenia tianjinensis]SFT89696.1 hypothetical protein SAMN05216474_3019 [Lishizhenia tianjinensis]